MKVTVETDCKGTAQGQPVNTSKVHTGVGFNFVYMGIEDVTDGIITIKANAFNIDKNIKKCYKGTQLTDYIINSIAEHYVCSLDGSQWCMSPDEYLN